MYAVLARRPPARRELLLAAALAGGALGAAPSAAQQPPTPPAAVLPYRVPVIALVQPPEGGSIPQDRPVVVFRFVQGDPDDPLDLGSFRVSVDGIDRTELFTVGAAEAWGPIAPPSTNDVTSVVTVGVHQLGARICSMRGACAAVSTVVSVEASQPDSVAVPIDLRSSRRKRLIDLVIEAARRLLTP